jgi:arylsulfatase A-like enzyme
VLSSDHGVADIPGALIDAGRDGGRVVLSQIEATKPFADLLAKLGGKAIRSQWPPYVYLDEQSIREHHGDPEQAAHAIAAQFAATPGIQDAFTRSEILKGELPDTESARAVRRSFHPDRSGDIHIVSRPGWQIAYEGSGALPYATGHGTPWRYDSLVPLVFDGPGIHHDDVSRHVETVDVAPTIAAILGIQPPARATGHALEEALH